MVEFSYKCLDCIFKFVFLVLSCSTLVVKLLLEVDDLLLEFFGLGGNGFLESGSLLLNGIELEILSFSVLSGEGVSELGEGFLGHDSLVSESLLRVSNGSAKGLDRGVDFLLGPFSNSIDSSIELLELITEVVVELAEELRVGRVTVWRVFRSWGNMLSVDVLFFVMRLLGKVNLEDLSLDIKTISERSSSFLEGFIEGFVVVFNLIIKRCLGVDFTLSEIFSQILADYIKFGSLNFTEGLEFLMLDEKSISESFSGLANGFSDGGGLSFKEFDEVELVVGVVDEVDLLELPGLGGIESSLFLSERVFEGGFLGIHRFNEGVVIVDKSIVECSRISVQNDEESSSLFFDRVVKGNSG